MLLNGDELDVPPWCAELDAAVAARQQDGATGGRSEWWSRRDATPARGGHHSRTAGDHLEALRAAGFERRAVLWQRFGSHLLAASV